MLLNSKRDNKILEMMGVFNGKTFGNVLAKTLWVNNKNGFQQSMNRVRKLRDNFKIFKLVPTGLLNPRNAIILTQSGKDYCDLELGLYVGEPHLSVVTINHNMLEQIVWYWLSESGREVTRTTVKSWVTDKRFKHAPDLYFEDENGGVYCEIETSKKSKERYNEIFVKIRKDGIKKVIYFFENAKRMEQIGRVIPLWEKVIFYVDIEEMIKNEGKADFIPQRQFLANL